MESLGFLKLRNLRERPRRGKIQISEEKRLLGWCGCLHTGRSAFRRPRFPREVLEEPPTRFSSGFGKERLLLGWPETGSLTTSAPSASSVQSSGLPLLPRIGGAERETGRQSRNVLPSAPAPAPASQSRTEKDGSGAQRRHPISWYTLLKALCESARFFSIRIVWVAFPLSFFPRL